MRSSTSYISHKILGYILKLLISSYYIFVLAITNNDDRSTTIKICLSEKFINEFQSIQVKNALKEKSFLKKIGTENKKIPVGILKLITPAMDFYFHPYYVISLPRRERPTSLKPMVPIPISSSDSITYKANNMTMIKPVRFKISEIDLKETLSTESIERDLALSRQKQTNHINIPSRLDKEIEQFRSNNRNHAVEQTARPKEEKRPLSNSSISITEVHQLTRRLEVDSCKISTQEIHYYSIYKSGNTFIRHMMRKLATTYSAKKLNEIPILAALKFKAETLGKVPQLKHIPEDQRKVLAKRLSDRYFSRYPDLLESTGHYSFTFVRDPINRFISGYTEVEYRLSRDNKTYVNDKSWQSLPLGSSERFQAYIQSILNSNGKRQIVLRQCSYNDHIMPQIGTVYHATNLFRSSLHIYKLENFNDDWVRMLNDSQILKCIPDQKVSEYRSGIFSDDNFQPHASSSDPLNTTNVVKAFLTNGMKPSPSTSHFAQTNSSTLASTPDSSNSTNNNNTNLATVYVRILCRLYLVDYICLDYKLPEVCHDLYDEFDQFVKTSSIGSTTDVEKVAYLNS